MPFPISILEASKRLGREPTPYDFDAREIEEVIASLERCIEHTHEQDVLDDLYIIYEQFTRFLDKESVQKPWDFFGLNILEFINQKPQ